MKEQKGQSVVEMAVISSASRIMFLGLIELGHAIRGYYIILGVSRDIARFSSRDDFRSLWQTGTPDEAYGLVEGHFNQVMTLPLTEDNYTVLIHRYDIWTELPCVASLDDVIIHPGLDDSYLGRFGGEHVSLVG